MARLATEYEFVLPRGYVDRQGEVHRSGIMRLATARDELEPLRDPMVSGPDDPRLTILVLARVVSKLGTLDLVTPHEIEGLFTADLAYLQDFYGVINFGSQEEYEALLADQAQTPPPPTPVRPGSVTAAPAVEASTDDAAGAGGSDAAAASAERPAPARRAQITEIGAASR
jgi:hypothetical protein